MAEIKDLIHPSYSENTDVWEKYRLTMGGGEPYVQKYLYRHDREDVTDFNTRQRLTYNPAFAKEAILEVSNAIHQRLSEITRTGNQGTFAEVADGGLSGVDLNGSSMTIFIDREIVSELLSMGSVGIYVDMPNVDDGMTLFDTDGIHPYLYSYTVENILNWTYYKSVLTSVLLKEQAEIKDEETGLVVDYEDRYRFVKMNDSGQVEVTFYNEEGVQIDVEGNATTSAYILDIQRIPFVLVSIGPSLLTDVADYQITLLNIISADIWYIHKGHAPFFVYQYDPKNVFDKLFGRKNELLPEDQKEFERNIIEQDEENESMLVGANRGLKIPSTVEFPKFVSPPSDSLEISMKKQEQMKLEIKELVHLNLSLVHKSQASAESKELDNRGLEAGLSNIGLILERAENQIAAIWAEYEKITEVPEIKYPEKYDLKSDKDRREDARDLDNLKVKIPSRTAQLEISKQVASILLGHRTPYNIMETINSEIDAAQGTTSDSETIALDVERGLVSTDTASLIRGYLPGESTKAEADHARRIQRIQQSQTNGFGARGIDDLDSDPQRSAKEEKERSRDNTLAETATERTRGDG